MLCDLLDSFEPCLLYLLGCVYSGTNFKAIVRPLHLSPSALYLYRGCCTLVRKPMPTVISQVPFSSQLSSKCSLPAFVEFHPTQVQLSIQTNL